MEPFQVKNDESEWVKVYRAFSGDIGEVVRYDDLNVALGRNFTDARAPLYRAMRELEQKRHRTLEVVPNIGYRIVSPSEHERLAKKHHKKGRRALGRSSAKLSSADRSLLSPAEIERIDKLELVLGQQRAAISRLEAKTEAHEKAIKSHAAKLEQLASSAVTSRVEGIEAVLREAGLLKKD